MLEAAVQAPFQEQSNEKNQRLHVIGIGDAGCKAASAIWRSSVRGTTVTCIDTDSSSLQRSQCDKKILLRAHKFRGFGSAGDRDSVAATLTTSLADIRQMITGAGCVLIISSGSGTTGSTVAPPIASEAKAAGSVTLAAVVMPFDFEGPTAQLATADFLDALKKTTDAVLEVNPSSDSLLAASRKNERKQLVSLTSLLSGLVSSSGVHNSLDSAPLANVLTGGAYAIFGSSTGYGHTGAYEASQKCIDSALSDEVSRQRLDQALILIEAGTDLTVSELATITETIEARLGRSIDLQIQIGKSRLLIGSVRVSLVGTLREVRRPVQMIETISNPVLPSLISNRPAFLTDALAS